MNFTNTESEKKHPLGRNSILDALVKIAANWRECAASNDLYNDCNDLYNDCADEIEDLVERCASVK
jgi:hypothetical protein